MSTDITYLKEDGSGVEAALRAPRASLIGVLDRRAGASLVGEIKLHSTRCAFEYGLGHIVEQARFVRHVAPA